MLSCHFTKQWKAMGWLIYFMVFLHFLVQDISAEKCGTVTESLLLAEEGSNVYFNFIPDAEIRSDGRFVWYYKISKTTKNLCDSRKENCEDPSKYKSMAKPYYLAILNVSLHDSGNYLVYCENGAWSSPGNLTVQKVLKPDLVETFKRSGEDGSTLLELKCSSDIIYSDVILHWHIPPYTPRKVIPNHKEEGSAFVSKILQLNLTRQHNGLTISCSVASEEFPGKNLTSSYTIDITYAPVIDIFELGNKTNQTERNITVLAGENVTLRCEVDSNPPAIMGWYKGGTLVLGHCDLLHLQCNTSNTDTLDLHLANISTDIPEGFVCNAKNKVATVHSKKVFVTVIVNLEKITEANPEPTTIKNNNTSPKPDSDPQEIYQKAIAVSTGLLALTIIVSAVLLIYEKRKIRKVKAVNGSCSAQTEPKESGNNNTSTANSTNSAEYCVPEISPYADSKANGLLARQQNIDGAKGDEKTQTAADEIPEYALANKNQRPYSTAVMAETHETVDEMPEYAMPQKKQRPYSSAKILEATKGDTGYYNITQASLEWENKSVERIPSQTTKGDTGYYNITQASLERKNKSVERIPNQPSEVREVSAEYVGDIPGKDGKQNDPKVTETPDATKGDSGYYNIKQASLRRKNKSVERLINQSQEVRQVSVEYSRAVPGKKRKEDEPKVTEKPDSQEVRQVQEPGNTRKQDDPQVAEKTDPYDEEIYVNYGADADGGDDAEEENIYSNELHKENDCLFNDEAEIEEECLYSNELFNSIKAEQELSNGNIYTSETEL